MNVSRDVITYHSILETRAALEGLDALEGLVLAIAMTCIAMGEYKVNMEPRGADIDQDSVKYH